MQPHQSHSAWMAAGVVAAPRPSLGPVGQRANLPRDLPEGVRRNGKGLDTPIGTKSSEHTTPPRTLRASAILALQSESMLSVLSSAPPSTLSRWRARPDWCAASTWRTAGLTSTEWSKASCRSWRPLVSVLEKVTVLRVKGANHLSASVVGHKANEARHAGGKANGLCNKLLHTHSGAIKAKPSATISIFAHAGHPLYTMSRQGHLRSRTGSRFLRPRPVPGMMYQ